MGREIAEKIIYIFESATVLMSLLAIIGVFSFYLVFSVYCRLKVSSKMREVSLLGKCAREIFILKVLAFCAPLLGLLGTVIGIGKCIASVDDSQGLADGISYALLTTQTGLIMAIPAWICAIVLTKKLKELTLRLGGQAQ